MVSVGSLGCSLAHYCSSVSRADRFISGFYYDYRCLDSCVSLEQYLLLLWFSMTHIIAFFRSVKLHSAFWLLIVSAHSLGANPAATVVIDDDVLIDYKKFIANKEPMSLDTYSGVGSRRDIVELLLFIQILEVGGFSHEIDFHNEHSYRRMLAMVASGKVLAYGTPAWSGDLVGQEHKYWYSEEMVRAEDFVVGAYTSVNNLKALESGAKNLHQLSAVTSRQWRVDWNVLNNLKVKHLYSASNWPNMLKMVGAQRADFTLSPFYPNPEMAIRKDGVTLVPIPNVRISLGEGRRWAVSLKHPMSSEMQKAIAKGMEMFRQRGTIERAYTESGFFDSRVSHWPIINANNKAKNLLLEGVNIQ